jgi:hypothetical protein
MQGMEVLHWSAERWFDVIQTVGIIGGLLLTAHEVRKNQKARTIANTIAVNRQYSRIWHEFYERPELARILQKDTNLSKQPVSNDESLFIKTLLLHLDVVRRAMKAGVFVKIQGLQNDVRDFFTLPIPKLVWEKMKPFQDDDFVAFIENCLRPVPAKS